MRIPQRLRDLARRYLLAEVLGTVTALIGTLVAFRLTGSPYVAAMSGSICEGVGYYAVIGVRDIRESMRTRGGTGGRAAVRTVPGILVEFAPAELLDTLVVRPLFMVAGPMITGEMVGGTIAGKIAADVAFYAIVLPS